MAAQYFQTDLSEAEELQHSETQTDLRVGQFIDYGSDLGGIDESCKIQCKLLRLQES